jgi:hypothetical protein
MSALKKRAKRLAEQVGPERYGYAVLGSDHPYWALPHQWRNESPREGARVIVPAKEAK